MKSQTHEAFQCTRLSAVANVTLTFTHISEANVKRCTSIDCAQKEQCGVCTQDHNGDWNYDWTKCVHPQSSPKHG